MISPACRERGEAIRKYLWERRHLENPITFFHPDDGEPIRVWLARDKNGNGIVGDVLWWGVNGARKGEE